MLIMLDIDGCLNNPESGYGRPFDPRRTPPRKDLVQWDEQCVDNLIEIVAQTNAKIVISSSWRHDYHYTEIGRMLELYGGERDWVVGQTPEDIPRARRLQGIGLAPSRGDEVAYFLNETGYDGAYVCIDDHRDFYMWQPLVQTDWQKGLTHDEALLVIEMLRKQHGEMMA